MNQTNKWLGLCCEDQHEARKPQGITAATQGGLDTKAGCVKNVGSERKVKKNAYG